MPDWKKRGGKAISSIGSEKTLRADIHLSKGDYKLGMPITIAQYSKTNRIKSIKTVYAESRDIMVELKDMSVVSGDVVKVIVFESFGNLKPVINATIK